MVMKGDHLDDHLRTVENRKNASIMLKNLNKIFKSSKYNNSRWIWELIQNAKDTASESNPVDIVIAIDSDYLSFSHNGNGFTLDDLAYLIFQGSAKSPSNGKSGRFGSGFLTTHLLSKEVKIEGTFLSGMSSDEVGKYERFEITIDRNTTDTEELARRINQTWEELKKNRTQIDDPIDTKFEYDLSSHDEASKSTILQELERLGRLIPFVLVFTPQISSLTIEDQINDRQTIFRRSNDQDEYKTTICKIVDQEEERVTILTNASEEVQIALLVESSDTKNIGEMSDIPKLFSHFPLIGTELFPFPVVVHSEGFSIKEDRNMIWLNDTEDDEIERNKEILMSTAKLYRDLLKDVISGEYEKTYNIMMVPNDTRNFDIDKMWYLDLRDELRRILSQIPLVNNVGGHVVTPEDIRIPHLPDGTTSSREVLWNYCNDLGAKDICLKDEIEVLEKVSWNAHSNGKYPGWGEVTIPDLVEMIEKIGSLDGLEEILNGSVDGISWLRNVAKFIETKGFRDRLNKEFKIFPNRNGNLCKLQDLEVDEIDDEELIKIYDLLGHNLKSLLLHRDYTIDDDFKYLNCESYTRKKLAEEIEEEIMEYTTGSHISLELGLSLHEWFEKATDSETLFPRLSQHKDSIVLASMDHKIQGQMVEISKVDGGEKVLQTVISKLKTDGPEVVRKLLEGSDSIAHTNLPSREDYVRYGIVNEDRETSIGRYVPGVHTSRKDYSRMVFAKEINKKAVDTVLKFLKDNGKYIIPENVKDMTSGTVISGVKKEGHPITLVVRSSMYDKIIFYDKDEVASLVKSNSELWVHDGGSGEPMRLSLGEIIMGMEINMLTIKRNLNGDN